VIDIVLDGCTSEILYAARHDSAPLAMYANCKNCHEAVAIAPWAG